MDNSTAIINQLRSQTPPLRWVQLALDAQCNRKLWKLVSGSQTRHFSRQKSITATRHSHTKKSMRAIFNEYLSPVSYILGFTSKLAFLPNSTPPYDSNHFPCLPGFLVITNTVITDITLKTWHKPTIKYMFYPFNPIRGSQIQILLTNLDNFSSKQMVRIEVYDREGVTLIFKGDG